MRNLRAAAAAALLLSVSPLAMASAVEAKPLVTVDAAAAQASLDKIISDIAALTKRMTATETVDAVTKADLDALTKRVMARDAIDEATKVALTDILNKLASGEAKATENAAQIAGIQLILLRVGERLKALETPTTTPPPPPPPVPDPSLNLSASPLSIAPGDKTRLNWSSQNATGCSASGDWSGAKSLSGSEDASPTVNSTYSMDCAEPSGKHAARSVSVSVTPPPPPPPSPAPGSRADNGFVVTNASGVAQTKYPVQAGLPLVCGEILHYPQALVNGSLVPTQADVKNRCPDGSAKFAVVSFYMDIPTTGPVKVEFKDQATSNNTPLTSAQLLAAITDDVRIELTQPATLTGAMDADTTKATWQADLLAKLKVVTNGSLAFSVDGVVHQVTGINLSAQPSLGYALWAINTAVQSSNLPVKAFTSIEGRVYAFGGKTLKLAVPTTGTDLGPLLFKTTTAATTPQTVTSASINQMLQDGSCAPWTQGPVAQTMLCRDHSANPKYDLGFSTDGKPIRLMFYATLWPDVGKVEVDAVAEIANSQNLQSRFYDVRILTGTTEAYAQKGIAHVAGTRWVRHVWLGGAPEQRINRKRDIGYLVDTNYLPPYDRTVVVPETVLAERWNNWANSEPHSRIGDPGWWNTSMPTPGERCEIGWTTCWTKRYLDTGDWRMREIATVQADLFGGFNAYYREGNALKFMDKAKAAHGLGFPVVPYDRPTSWSDDDRAFGNAADRLNFVGPLDWYGFPDLFNRSGWNKDAAHRPAPDYGLYLDTGNFYYLEEAQFWAARGMFSAGPGYGYSSRGPGVRTYDQHRAQAWLTRDLANAWAISPDNDPFKAVLKDATTDFLACFEGERAIKGSTLQTHPMWTYCQSLKTEAPIYATLQDEALAPLHWWDPSFGYYTTDPTYYDPNFAAGASAHWAQSYLTMVLGQVVRIGLPADGIFKWTASNLIWQAVSPDYNPWLQGQYVIPSLKWVTDASGVKTAVPLQTPAETMKAWAATIRNDRSNNVVVYPGNTENYLTIAAAAGAMVAEVMARPDVWEPFQTMLNSAPYNWGADARWRMIPRTK